MTKANAKVTTAAIKTATRKAKNPPYKHVARPPLEDLTGETDRGTLDPVTSETTTKDTTMTKPVKSDEATLAEAKAKIKTDKLAAAAAAKQKVAADKLAKTEAAAKAKAEKAEKLEAERAEKAEKRAAAKADRELADRSGAAMANLGERTKAGQYVKGANGQLRSDDAVAVAMETVRKDRTVPLLETVLGIDASVKYPNLNYGQRSMNLRNILRGRFRKETGDEKFTGTNVLDQLIATRDGGDYKVAAPEAA